MSSIVSPVITTLLCAVAGFSHSLLLNSDFYYPPISSAVAGIESRSAVVLSSKVCIRLVNNMLGTTCFGS